MFDDEIHRQDAIRNKHLKTVASVVTNIEKINTKLRKECAKYFGMLGGRPPLVRGMFNKNSSGIAVVRKDRKSSMNQKVADYLNDWLESHGHMRRDQSIMCSSSMEHADIFGRPSYIFPIGAFRGYTWVEAKDVNMEYSQTGWDTYTIEAWYARDSGMQKNAMQTKQDDRIMAQLKKPFAEYFHTNKGLNIAYGKEYEIWIDCDKYYYYDIEKYNWDKAKGLLEFMDT